MFGSAGGFEEPGCLGQLLLLGSTNQALALLKGVSMPIQTEDCALGFAGAWCSLSFPFDAFLTSLTSVSADCSALLSGKAALRARGIGNMSNHERVFSSALSLLCELFFVMRDLPV